MKIPKYLFKPVASWTYYNGMKRAIAVINVQAYILKKAGKHEQAAALKEVAAALLLASNRNTPTPEGITLKWPNE